MYKLWCKCLTVALAAALAALTIIARWAGCRTHITFSASRQTWSLEIGPILTRLVKPPRGSESESSTRWRRKDTCTYNRGEGL